MERRRRGPNVPANEYLCACVSLLLAILCASVSVTGVHVGVCTSVVCVFVTVFTLMQFVLQVYWKQEKVPR